MITVSIATVTNELSQNGEFLPPSCPVLFFCHIQFSSQKLSRFSDQSGNRNLCRPTQSVIIQVNKSDACYAVVTRMITDRTGLHSLLLPLLILLWKNYAVVTIGGQLLVLRSDFSKTHPSIDMPNLRPSAWFSSHSIVCN